MSLVANIVKQTNIRHKARLVVVVLFSANGALRVSTCYRTPAISALTRSQAAATATTRRTQPSRSSSHVLVASARACTTPTRARSVLPVRTMWWVARAAKNTTTITTSTTVQSHQEPTPLTPPTAHLTTRY